MKNKYIILLKLCVSIILLVFIFTKIDFEAFKNVFSNITLLYLCIALLLTFVGNSLSAWKWKIALEAQDIHINFFTLLWSSLIARFLGNVLPTSYGGDVFRAYDTSKISNKKVKSITAILFDRLVGFFVLLSISLIASFFVPEFRWLIPIISGILLVAVLVFILTEHRIERILPFSDRILRFDKKNVLKRARECIAIYKKHPQKLASIFAVSLLLQLNVILFNFFVAKGLGLTIPLGVLFVFVPLISVLAIIPISINGLGVREFSYVYLFGLAGILKHEALFMSLTYYFIMLISSLSGSIVYVLRKR